MVAYPTLLLSTRLRRTDAGRAAAHRQALERSGCCASPMLAAHGGLWMTWNALNLEGQAHRRRPGNGQTACFSICTPRGRPSPASSWAASPRGESPRLERFYDGAPAACCRSWSWVGVAFGVLLQDTRRHALAPSARLLYEGPRPSS